MTPIPLIFSVEFWHLGLILLNLHFGESGESINTLKTRDETRGQSHR